MLRTGRDLRRRARLGVFALSTAICFAAPAWAADRSTSCPAGEVLTATGCASLGDARAEVEGIVEEFAMANGLRAALVRIEVGDRRLATVATGESMAGVPANPRMHFRIGAMGIPYLVNLLLQLQDDGVLSLDDPVSNWLPELPDADRVTLRMLASSTSGYPDWIQGNPAFVDALFADVFYQWSPAELLRVAFDLPIVCEPGACFTYSHANFAILSKVLHQETGQTVKRLLRRRVFAPLGLRDIGVSPLPAIPGPVLHSYSADRGPYEDSTYWSPSWTVGKDSIMTGNLRDITKTVRAVGTGELISRAASREQFSARNTAGFPGFSEDRYFGLGIAVENGWRFQNPELNGYTGIMAYLPEGEISLGLTVTKGRSVAADPFNYSQRLWVELADYLAPDNPVNLPG